jgi:hypothetical protein
MANLRRHFKVAWNGGEPVHIVTNARDIAEAGELEASKVTTGFAVVYSALQRNGLDVPPTLDQFIDQLDEMDGNANGSTEALNPTDSPESSGAPLP